MAARVLVTRPEPGASKTAARLAGLGFEPVVLPLSKIVPREPQPLGRTQFDIVAVSSANAVRHAPASLIARLAALPCHAVGAATAAAARAAGFPIVLIAAGDAAALARQVCERCDPGTRVAYLCGRVRTPVLEDTLAECGMPVTAIVTYDTEIVSYSTDTLRRSLGSRKLDAMLVYSTVGAQAAVDLAMRPELAHLFEKTKYYCLSSRIADVISRHGAMHPAEPTEDALLDLLRRAA